jgi:hypothetical protein
MFIWRNLPPSAIVACFTYLRVRSDKRRQEREARAEERLPGRAAEQIQHIEQATLEIQSRV